MKATNIITIIFCVFLISCQKAVDIDVDLIPNKPFIKSAIIANMDSTGLLKGNISQINKVDTVKFVDTILVKDRTVNLKNIWIQMTLETGCKIVPLDHSPKLGAYGDYSTPAKYRVTAPSGKTADWMLIVEFVN